jgi:hypothetical protein
VKLELEELLPTSTVPKALLYEVVFVVIDGPAARISPVTEILSIAIPELLPVSAPRQTAHLICTTALSFAAAGKVVETVVFNPVVPAAWEYGFEPEVADMVVHEPLVPTLY